MKKNNIPFSPPDISDLEINEVVDTLKSGWITTGPKVAELEKKFNDYCSVEASVALSSATACEELILRELNLKKGDEVITTPYTYTATACPVIHEGILPKFVDVKKDSFLIDEDKIAEAITPNTRAIITVDFGGVPVDYDKIREILKSKHREDIVLISDSAHSFGAKYKGKRVGGQFDFHSFSFHAVKNFTTAEGGAITIRNNHFNGNDDLYHQFKLTSLQGQTKDALSKMKLGAWKYDIVTDGYKCNMTDIQAAIGLAQFQRYDGLLKRRAEIFEIYNKHLRNKDWAILPFVKDDIRETSYHLYPLRIKGFQEADRDLLIAKMADDGIATNVHFIPLPMFTLYKSLGYDIKNYPNAYAQYANEISLPTFSTLTDESAEIVITSLIKFVEEIIKNK